MSLRCIFILLVVPFISYSQQAISLDELAAPITKSQDMIHEYEFEVDLANLKAQLANAPNADDARRNEWVNIDLPLSTGEMVTFRAAESSILQGKMKAKYPGIKSYRVVSTGEKTVHGRIAITYLGLSGLISSSIGDVYYEPSDEGRHKAYTPNQIDRSNISCGTDHKNNKPHKGGNERDSYGGDIRTYRMAVAGSGEWSDKYGDDLPTINSKITEYLNELNVIYERDVAITIVLIENNDDIIFFNPATDGINPNNKLASAQSVISSNIPAADYELGHVFYEYTVSGGWSGSGVASLGVVCNNNSKARGWTGCAGNYPTSFWMGIFAHEVGHQFDAPHTFYGTTGNCSGSQRSVGNGVEPGSGNSLMSYEGNCGASGGCSSQNITPYASTVYLHSYSIGVIHDFINTSAQCSSNASSGNTPPVISMPTTYTIPKGTPFILEAGATDADGDALLMGWEEVDTDNLSLSCPNGAPSDAANSSTAPLFRSFDPSASGGTRYFPQLSDVINNTQTMGEILPNVERDIDFRFTARSAGYGGVSYEDLTISVEGNAGPFTVQTANAGGGYTASQSVNIQWDVANTNNAPVSCSNVNILFSLDGGDTYPITLASSVTNDGSHTVNMPAVGTTQGRIKVEGDGNIFYDINDADIVISSSCNPISSSIVNDDDVIANPGDPSLNLELYIGDVVTSFNDETTGSDPSANAVGKDVNDNNNCFPISFTPGYKSLILKATEADTYSFNSFSSQIFEVVNVYENAFNPSNICSTWLNSTMEINGNSASFTNPVTVTLQENDIIELVVSGFYTNDTGTFEVSFSSQGSGNLVLNESVPTGYSYKYVISKDGVIEDISDNSDLSDETNYPGGEYLVEGLMLFGTPNLNSFIGGQLSTLYNSVANGSVCGQFSTNSVNVSINGCTPSTVMITSIANTSIPGTLEYEMNNGCPGDMYMISNSLLGQTITLLDEIVIQDSLTIMGLGKNNFTISGGNSNRMFNIAAGGQLKLMDLSLKNGYAPTQGGAFISEGEVILENVLLEGNKTGTQADAFTSTGTVKVVTGVSEVKD